MSKKNKIILFMFNDKKGLDELGLQKQNTRDNGDIC